METKTNSELARDFLSARAAYRTNIDISEPEFEKVYDMGLSEADENAKCAIIEEQLGTQRALDLYNIAEMDMLEGLERFLKSHGKGHIFSTIRKDPVKCASVLIRGK